MSFTFRNKMALLLLIDDGKMILIMVFDEQMEMRVVNTFVRDVV